jgi:hypothetical protein
MSITDLTAPAEVPQEAAESVSEAIDPELAAAGVVKAEARPGRHKRLVDLFAGRKFVILREVHLPEDELFRTPLGHTGRNGWLVQEIGNPENSFIVGLSLLKLMHNKFDAIDLPAPKPRGRPKKQASVSQPSEKDQPILGESLAGDPFRL